MQSRRPLGPAVVSLIVVDAVLVLVFAILLVQSRQPASPEPADAPTTTDGATQVFASPSRNIGCTIEAGSATCSIAEFSYPPPDLPGCDGDVGHVVTLTADGASWVCVGGVVPGRAGSGVEVLPYGQSITADGFTCTSSEAGMTCRENESGHSFSLARGGATLD